MDIHALSNIEQASGRLAKEKLLSLLKEDTVKFLAKALDPMITFGVTADEDHLFPVWRRGKQEYKEAEYWDKFYDLLCQLQNRKLTGGDAHRAIEGLISNCYRDEAIIWSCRILNKNLRMGVQVTTLNEVFPGTVEEWDVALADTFDPNKHELSGEYVREPKLDGLRMIVYEGVAYTRNGRIIESVGHIIDELSQFSSMYVFDGEVMGVGNFDEASGKIRRKGEGPDNELVYNVFDVIDIEGWRRRDTYRLRQRKEHMKEVFDSTEFKNVKMVPWVVLEKNPTSNDIVDCGDAYIADGFEGAMIKDLDQQYQFKRSDAILKVKRFISADGYIASSYEGKGRNKGRLGGVFVTVDGIQSKCGSGFSDAQRIDLWKNVDSLEGKMIEVKYQQKTKEGKLRFPVFKKFRPDKE